MNDIRDVEKIADAYLKIRGKYALLRGYKGVRRVLPTKRNPAEGKNWKYFVALLELSKSVENFDVLMYIESQFYYSRREVYPKDLVTEYAVKRYFRYLREKPYEKEAEAKRAEYESIKRSEEFANLYMKNNNLTPSSKKTWNGVEISVLTWLYLNRMLSHRYAATNDIVMSDLEALSKNGMFDQENYKALCVMRAVDMCSGFDE